MADDPVGDFLAREKAELGDITAELGNGTGSDIGSTEDLRKDDGFVIEPRIREAVDEVHAKNPDAHTEVPDFHTESPEMYHDSPEVHVHGDSSVHLSESTSASPAPGKTSPPPDAVKKESPIMESWRVNFNTDIKTRDEKEETRRCELEASAKKELETWYAHYRQQQSVKSSDYRSEAPKDPSGKAYSGYSGPKPSVTDTGVWESVCGMCDMQGKNSRTTHDLSRMRGLLLSLKSPATNSAA